jgi:hypothetical protein
VGEVKYSVASKILPLNVVANTTTLSLVLKQNAFFYQIGDLAKSSCPANFCHGNILSGGKPALKTAGAGKPAVGKPRRLATEDRTESRSKVCPSTAAVLMLSSVNIFAWASLFRYIPNAFTLLNNLP